MRGLLLNDLYTMKRTMRTYVMFMALFVILGYVSGSVSFFTSFITVYSMMIGVSIFAYHEQCNWDAYANTLPVSRGQMVGSFYALSGIALLGGAVLGSLLKVPVIIKGEMTIGDGIVETGLMLVVGICMISMMIPVILKFGNERGRIVMLGTYIVLFLSAFILLDGKVPGIVLTEGDILVLVGIGLTVSLLVLLISYRIARLIYIKKEF